MVQRVCVFVKGYPDSWKQIRELYDSEENIRGEAGGGA